MAQPGIGEVSILAILIYCFVRAYWSQSLALLFLLGVLFTTFIYFRNLSTVWTSQSVPGPFALPFLGNPKRIKQGNHVYSMENCRKYGKFWGGYQFMLPELYVTDPEALKHVLVKDFDVFTNRQTVLRDNDECDRPNPSLVDLVVTVLHDEKWKQVRKLMTPAFTAGKIKMCWPHIQQAVDTLVSVVGDSVRKSEAIHMKEPFCRFAVDVMSAAGLGIRVDCQRNEDDPIVRYTEEAFNFGPNKPIIWFIACFPWLSTVLKETFGIRLIFASGQEYFMNLFKKLKEERKVHPVDPPDFLQMMLNSSVNNEFADMPDLTEFEIMSQMVIFIVAGSESTGGTLTYLSYLLAIHPKVQEKCYAEVMEAFEGKEALTFEDVQSKLDYLEACINESLRIYPIAPTLDRVASKPYNLGGVQIPEGCTVIVPVYVIHHSEEFYEDPETFNPERFLPEQRKLRDPITFLPFGYGPRNCFGARFAMFEMKLCFANFLRAFKMEASDQTEIPLSLNSTNMNLQTNHPIILNLKHR